MPALKRVTPAKRTPAQRKPQARGDVTHDRLLEVARDQFVRHGFHGTSMRQIAAAAGLAVGGIYNHFGGKEEVFAAVLDANHPYHVVEAALQDVAATSLEAFVRETAARVAAAVQGRQQQIMTLMFIELVEFQGRHMRLIAEREFPKILAFVQRFDQSTERRRQLPGPLVLRAFVNLIVGHLVIDAVLSQSPVLQQLGYGWPESEVDIFLHGVLE